MDGASTLRLWVRPRMWPLHVLLVVVVVATVLMGLWQLGVYDSRRADERADERRVPTVALREVLAPGEEFTGRDNRRPVSVTGRFSPAADQFWVSGRRSAGRTGYWLVAPLLVDDADRSAGRPPALLVVRGWARDNGTLPEPIAGPVTLQAVLLPGESDDGELGPRRTAPAIRIPYLVNVLPYDLYSGFAVVTSQRPAEVGVLTPADPPSQPGSWTTGLRNLAYAVQWWLFGAFGVVMWWRIGSEQVAQGRLANDRADEGSTAQVG